MQFLYPNLLWALLLIAAPIIIHLFYFKRFKKVYFSNVKFLKEVKEQTSSRNKLKHFLILLSRILAIVCLVFAFAQPYLTQEDNLIEGPSGISIYIDNTFSMEAEKEGEPLLQKAKKKALEISNAYSEQDRIQILTADFEGQHQRFVSPSEIKGLVDVITPTAEVRELSSIINRQKQAFRTDAFNNQKIYILSDFQKSITDEVEVDSTLNLEFIPIQSSRENNLAIDSVYFDSNVALLNQVNKAYVVISNYSNEETEKIRVQLEIDDQTKPVGTFSLKAKETKTFAFNITPTRTGWYEARLKISDFPITYDNNYQFAFYVNEEVQILALNQNSANPYLTAVFKDMNYFNVTNISVQQIKYNLFEVQDLIILNDLLEISSGLESELEKYVSRGGKLLIFPSPNANIESYNSLLQKLKLQELKNKSTDTKKVNQINKEEFIFSGVYQNNQDQNIKLPSTTLSYSLSNYHNRTTENLLKFRDGGPYLIKNEYHEGFAYLCVAPLTKQYNDLVTNAEVFVPMLYKMSLANGKGGRLAYTIGVDNLIKSDRIYQGGDNSISLKGPIEFIPGIINNKNGTYFDVSQQLNEAGFYHIERDNKIEQVFAFNYNKKESDLDYLSIDELENLYPDVRINKNALSSNLTHEIMDKEKGSVLWRWFLLGALLFLFIETLLIRFIK